MASPRTLAEINTSKFTYSYFLASSTASYEEVLKLGQDWKKTEVTLLVSCSSAEQSGLPMAWFAVPTLSFLGVLPTEMGDKSVNNNP